ncbi:MAG TPA: hypothetical protein VLB46_01475 [Pyrinomonadaceae bacterium]|nr:hypothetical protein [Pyrinomonadaceae bacterium]
MKHLIMTFLALTALASISPVPVSAQHLSREAEEAEVLRQQAIGLLDKELDRTKSYNRERDRIIVSSRIADVTWTINPQRAKQLLRDAYALLANVKAEARENEDSTSLNLRTSTLRESLRIEIFSVAQKHDAALFQELLGSIKENPKKIAELHNRPEVFGSSSLQKRALVSMALKEVSSDPDKAIDYAVRSLGYGVPEEFGELFKALIVSNRPSASKLFTRATDVFVAEDSTNLYDAVILSSYLRLIPQPEPDTALVRRFLAGALERMNRVWLANQNSQPKDEMVGGALMMSSRHLYQFYRTYWPEKSNEVEALIRQVAGTSSDVREEELVPRETTADTIEEKIARASESKNEEERDGLYFEAALMLAKDGKYVRAREIASRADNLEKRAVVLTYINRQEAEDLIKRGELFNASRVIERIEDPELRVEAIVSFAKGGRKKEPYLTRNLLEDTRKLLEKDTGSVVRSRAYLWLASSYAVFDPALSFELMTSAVKLANKTKGFDATGPETKLIYLSRKSGKVIPVGTAKVDFFPGFRLLGRSDFWQAVSIADQFESQLLRGLSIVSIAEPILATKDAKSR